MTYATYNITDDKLRLSLGYKPQPGEVEKLRKAGFAYWPGSKLNVAKWSTCAEDYILSLGLEISEDDTPDNVESRVDRFTGYAEHAEKSAESASNSAHSILAGIPPGQPILVGHHSEHRHRNTLKRTDALMQRAVSESERAAHWNGRVAGAIAHAEYKERPGVIARRIKGLEADERTYKRELEKQGEIRANIFLSMRENVRKQLDVDYSDSPEVMAWIKANEEAFKSEFEQKFFASWTKHEKWATRWLDHIQKRLEYERALLEAMGGSPKLKWELEVGGQVKHTGNWHTILRINKKGGEIISVTTDSRFHKIKEVGGITDYRSPSEEETKKVKASVKRPPICNYPGEGFEIVTQADWNKCHKDYKGTRIIPASEQYPAHSVRTMMIKFKYPLVFISDAKEKRP